MTAPLSRHRATAERQYRASADYIRQRMQRRRLTEPERTAYVAQLRREAQQWKAAGGKPGDYPGAELLGELAQAEQPGAPSQVLRHGARTASQGAASAKDEPAAEDPAPDDSKDRGTARGGARNKGNK